MKGILIFLVVTAYAAEQGEQRVRQESKRISKLKESLSKNRGHVMQEHAMQESAQKSPQKSPQNKSVFGLRRPNRAMFDGFSYTPGTYTSLPDRDSLSSAMALLGREMHDPVKRGEEPAVLQRQHSEPESHEKEPKTLTSKSVKKKHSEHKGSSKGAEELTAKEKHRLKLQELAQASTEQDRLRQESKISKLQDSLGRNLGSGRYYESKRQQAFEKEREGVSNRFEELTAKGSTD